VVTTMVSRAGDEQQEGDQHEVPSVNAKPIHHKHHRAQRMPATSVRKAARPDARFQNTPSRNTAVIGGATYEMSLLIPSKIVV
jgi:hypothetical protein